MSEPGYDEECEDDRCEAPTAPISYCVDCDSSYCSECWPRQSPHKSTKRGRDGIPHEQLDIQIVRRLRNILSPSKDESEIKKQHEQNSQTKWFGVYRNLAGRSMLEDYGRYAALMSEISDTSYAKRQYPQLVSFIGVTNAGKSSLIKMLMQSKTSECGIGKNTFSSPVVGSLVHGNVPTSGDVHLYVDPTTHSGTSPILYADCEGFEGGECPPLGSLSQRRTRQHAAEDTMYRPTRTREIVWANTDDSRRREFAVTALYPRLLYTFSDCVVFVLRNPKTFQSSVLTKLLDWGAAAMEQSLNQPALPHCIVVVNGTDPGVNEREWDVDCATQGLLSSVSGALDYIEGVPRFLELARHWSGLGKRIVTTEDLILCYYSSFKVVRVPAHPQYRIMNEQIDKLHSAIREVCKSSFEAKQRARMVLGAEELNVYLQSGFDHFSIHLDVPFNFMSVSHKHNPIPSNFGEHILQLCTTLSDCFLIRSVEKVRWAFEKLSVMVASCVMLDCVRFRKGRLDELFPIYEQFLDRAMDEYLELHCPCAYTSPDGSRLCMLVKARHGPKGHQDRHGIIAAGEHIAAFDWQFAQQWKAQMRTAIEWLHRELDFELEQKEQKADSTPYSEECVAFDMHKQNLGDFFDAVGPATQRVSHSTCFCCLMYEPEHPLPCCHVLCNECIAAYGTRGKRSVTMTFCPLHAASSNFAPRIIRRKPSGAGVRILSLDSGGIRGIVQLELLRGIELALGDHMPLQHFFDLIVGAGTGGLIAASLAQGSRSVEDCLHTFKALCEDGFISKSAVSGLSNATSSKGASWLGQIAKAFSVGPRYRTGVLHRSLQTAFTDDTAFFDARGGHPLAPRVAVTSAKMGREGDTLLLSNYRRPQVHGEDFALERTHDPATELKTWECVAATMADPADFKPLEVHNNRTYVSGGVQNPAALAAKEAQYIWTDVHEPDICLSVGRGQDLANVNKRLQSSTRSLNTPSKRHGVTPMKPAHWGRRRTEDDVKVEQEWRSFKTNDPNRRHVKGLVRFNPDLGRELPPQAQKEHFTVLQALIRAKLQERPSQIALENLAQRLIALMFYYDVQSDGVDKTGTYYNVGVVACRLEPRSEEMTALGRVLHDRRSGTFEPFFQIRSAGDSLPMQSKFPITARKTATMIQEGIFEEPKVILRHDGAQSPPSIQLFVAPDNRLEPEGFPISGFPWGILQRHGGKKSHSRKPLSRRTGPQFGSRRTSLFLSESRAPRQPASKRASAIINSDAFSPAHSNPDLSSRKSSSVDAESLQGNATPDAHHTRNAINIEQMLSQLQSDASDSPRYSHEVLTPVERNVSEDSSYGRSINIPENQPLLGRSSLSNCSPLILDDTAHSPYVDTWCTCSSYGTFDRFSEDPFDEDDPFYHSLTKRQPVSMNLKVDGTSNRGYCDTTASSPLFGLSV